MNGKINFINGNTRKCLLAMVIPLLCAMILTMAYNIVDSLWVGNLLGENGYAALTNSTAIVLILSAIAMGASNGIAILISQMVGAGKMKEVSQAIVTLLVISGVFSTFITIILELFLKKILVAMKTPDEIFNLSYTYLAIYLIGYVFIYLYMQFTAVFRSYGDPIFQMKGMLISTIFNAILDPILIKTIGLAGAAWSTVISEVLCLIFAVIYHNKKKQFELSFRNLSCEYIFPLLKDAIPAMISGCIPAISSATMLYLVTEFGLSSIAAYGVTNKLEILLFYPAMAMNMGLTTIVGQCFGAGRMDRVKDYLKNALIVGGLFISVVSVIVIIFCGRLSNLFVDSIQVSKIVTGFFDIVSIGYVMYMITSCYLGVLSGYGKPGMSMILFFVYYIVIRIPLARILVNTNMGIKGIWTSILISHIVAAIIAVIQLKLVEKKLISNMEVNVIV